MCVCLHHYLDDVSNDVIEKSKLHDCDGEEERGVWLNLNGFPQPWQPGGGGQREVEVHGEEEEESQEEPHWREGGREGERETYRKVRKEGQRR